MATEYGILALDANGAVADDLATVTHTGSGDIGTPDALGVHLPVAGDYTFRLVTPETASYAINRAIDDLTAPTITGLPKDGFVLTINEGTYEIAGGGGGTITVTGTLYLDGTDVTGDMTGSDYTVPSGSLGKLIEWRERASDGAGGVSRQQRASVTGSGVFSFTDYYTTGQEGAAYDVSDLSTLGANADGTGAITTNGETVRYVADLSGNDNHLTVANTTNAPIYRTDGTYHWLEFDGVNHYLETAVIRWAQPEGYYVAMAAEVADATGSPNIQIAAADSDAGRVFQFRTGSGGIQNLSIGGSVDVDTSPATLAANTPFVAEGIVTDVSVEALLNGESNGALSDNITPSTESAPLRIFSTARSGGSFFAGNWFGGMVRDEPPTDAEQLEVTSFLAAKSGAVLS